MLLIEPINMASVSNLISAVNLYLSNPSNNAFFITGKWGIGKTHYLKNHLFDAMNKVKTTTNEQKTFFPVYISLFGVQNLDDLEKKVFLSAFPALRSDNIKSVKPLLKTFTRAAFSFMKLGNPDEYLKDLCSDYDERKYNDVVFCFDDIERRGTQLSLTEFSGLVNNLADTNGLKVILMADDTKLKSEDQNEFSAIKEKIIGVQVDYELDFNWVFNDIVEQHAIDESYNDFLLNFKDTIETFLNKEDYNLRYLTHWISYFRHVFYSVQKYIQENQTKEPVVCSSLREHWRDFVCFTFAVSIELRKHKLSNKNTEGLDSTWPILIMDAIKIGHDIPKTYSEEFLEKYFSDTNFKFYKTLYNHFTGGGSFDIDKFKKEFISINNIKADNTDVTSNFERLYFDGINNLSEEKYIALTREVLTDAYKGKYLVDSYPVVFYLAVRFNNPLKLNLGTLLKRLQNGINISLKENYKDKEPPTSWSLDKRPFSSKNVAPFQDEYDQLFNYLKFSCDNFHAEKSKQSIVQIKALIFHDPKRLRESFDSEQYRELYLLNPLFNMIPFTTFIRHFKKYNNGQLNAFVNFLRKRYKEKRLITNLELEKDFFIKLNRSLEAPTGNKFIKRHLYDKLRALIAETFESI